LRAVALMAAEPAARAKGESGLARDLRRGLGR